MGQWLSCAIFLSNCSSNSSSARSLSLSSSPPLPASAKHATLTAAAGKASNRRLTGTESTLVDSATGHSVTAFPLSTTNSFASSHLSTSPPPHHRYLSVSSFPFSTSHTSLDAVSSPPPQPTHVRSSSASSSTGGLTSAVAVQELYTNNIMVRTSSHVDDIIEEVIEPSPSPSSASSPYTPPVRPRVRSTRLDTEQQSVDDADDVVEGEVRCASLVPLHAGQALSPRSVLAFMIVANGGECETTDESSWEDDVEEVDDESEDDDDEEEMHGLSIHDIIAKLPHNSSTYVSPFISTVPSYSSVPTKLSATSSLRTTTRNSSKSSSYPSLTVLTNRSMRQQQQKRVASSEQAADSDDEVAYVGGHWC